MKQIFDKYARYNYWANERIGTLLKALDNSIIDKEIPSSFNTIRKTVFHIWDAEHIWLQRFNGSSPADWPSKQYGPGTPIEKFIDTSAAFRDLVLQLPEADIAATCTYKNMKGVEFTNPRYEIFMHLFNHSTFHRGQLVTMLRNAGISELPGTDFILYTREG